MATDPDIKFRPVDQSGWADFEALFESKGGPKYCWCMAWRSDADELKENNPASRKKFIEKRVQNHIPIGFLAYIHDEPVAWCSVAPRETYRRLGGDETLENVWSLACFFIKRAHRDKGLVDKLIQHAKRYAKENGANYLEAYPVQADSPSYRFMGFVPTFEKAGFHFVKKAGTRRHVMTCEL